MRSSDYKFACRVDMKDEIISEKRLYPVRQFFDNTRYQYIPSIILYLSEHGIIFIKFIVLCGYHNGMNLHRVVIVIIFNCYLRFGIRSQVKHYFIFSPDGGELL